MPNIYDTVNQFNRALNAREKAQWVEMTTRWKTLENNLQGSIDRLVAEIAERQAKGLPVNQFAITRLETWTHLQDQIISQSHQYEAYATNVIKGEQIAYAETGLAASQNALASELGYGVAFNKVNIKAVDTMIGLAGDGSPLFSVLEKRAIAPEMVSGLIDSLVEGVARGYSPRKTARLMADGLSQGLTKALTIARTEQIRAYRTAQLTQYEQSGVSSKVQRHAAPTERTCLACIALDGQITDVKDGFPSHPNCILPDNEVAAPDLLAASKAFYSGGAIELTVNGGRKISVTENHPILTARGFVSAKFLQTGDYVISAANIERIFDAINPNYNHIPSSIEEIFSSIEKINGVFARTVKASSEDFHGDARSFNGNVDIIDMNGFLLSDVDATRSKHIGKNEFSSRDIRSFALSENRSFDFFSNGLNSIFSGGMSGFDLRGSLLAGHRSPLDNLAFRLTAWRDSIFNNSLAKGSTAHTSLSREFVLRFARDITREKIVNVRNYNFTGHVYDLQTKMYELYTCNGVIVKNCRCFFTPVIDGVDNPNRSTQSWLEKQDEATQRNILGSHYDAYSNGMPLADMVRVKDDPTWGQTISIVPLKELQ